MTPGRIDDLFVRYWDDALTEPEAAELTRLLGSDPNALWQFQLLSLQSVAAAESPAPLSPVAEPRKTLTRRQWLGAAGLTGALGTAFGVGLAWTTTGRRPVGAVLARTVGRVLVRSEMASLGSIILPGDVLAVEGVGSSAVLKCQDGSEVVLGGDTVATLDADPGPRLVVHRGGVAAELAAGGSSPFALATKEATTFSDGGMSRVTVGRFGRQTEVGVLEGRVRVARPGGSPLLEMAGGEIGTVTPNGARKEARPPLPTDYAWDFTRPLPPDWEAGRLEQTPAGPVVRATYWSGKHAEPAYQVRSPNGWTSGLISLDSDSVLVVKYKLAKVGSVQVFIVVRPETRSDSTAMVFDAIRPPEDHRVGEWHTINTRLSALKTTVSDGVVPFGPPWVGFIVGMNTFEFDLGLQVAECRISRHVPPVQR